MIAERLDSQFVVDEQGAFTSSYGPYLLKSAFQPIFSEDNAGLLTIDACEALIRPFRGIHPVSPGEFFAAVDPAEALNVDSLCRELHILNMAKLGRKSAKLFVNFNPALFRNGVNVNDAISRMFEACGQVGFRPSRVVCEITEQGADETTLLSLVERLRSCRFKIAVDDYGSEESDSERVERIKPDYIKFDSAWIRRFSETQAGVGLLRLMVERFTKQGIECLFEGLEEEHQLTLCEEIGVRLMQGYALARPEIAPTSFDVRFPENPSASVEAGGSVAKAAHQEAGGAIRTVHASAIAPAQQANPILQRRTATFGKRYR